jgi:hypothetical protein
LGSHTHPGIEDFARALSFTNVFEWGEDRLAVAETAARFVVLTLSCGEIQVDIVAQVLRLLPQQSMLRQEVSMAKDKAFIPNALRPKARRRFRLSHAHI